MSYSNRLNKTLSNFGLNKNEIAVFNYLLNAGKSSMTDIIKGLVLPRATVYQKVDSLLKKHFVKVQKIKNTTYVELADPESIKKIIRQKAEKYFDNYNYFKRIYPEFMNNYNLLNSQTKVLYFEGVEGIRKMILDFEMNSKSKNIYGFTSVDISNILGETCIKKYHQKFIKKNYIDHFIISNDKINRKYINELPKNKLYKENRIKVKILDKKIYNPKVTVSIYDDKYAVFHMNKNNLFGVIIINK